jgi:hypothetical protein
MLELFTFVPTRAFELSNSRFFGVCESVVTMAVLEQTQQFLSLFQWHPLKG